MLSLAPNMEEASVSTTNELAPRPLPAAVNHRPAESWRANVDERSRRASRPGKACTEMRPRVVRVAVPPATRRARRRRRTGAFFFNSCRVKMPPRRSKRVSKRVSKRSSKRVKRPRRSRPRHRTFRGAHDADEGAREVDKFSFLYGTWNETSSTIKQFIDDLPEFLTQAGLSYFEQNMVRSNQIPGFSCDS